MFFFRRRPEAPASDLYTSLPTQRSRRQSEPPKGRVSVLSSLIGKGTLQSRNDGSSSHDESLAPSANEQLDGAGMVRRKSRSVPEMRDAHLSYGHGNGVEISDALRARRDSSDPAEERGRAHIIGPLKPLALVDRMNQKDSPAPTGPASQLPKTPRPSSIPQRSNIPRSHLINPSKRDQSASPTKRSFMPQTPRPISQETHPTTKYAPDPPGSHVAVRTRALKPPVPPRSRAPKPSATTTTPPRVPERPWLRGQRVPKGDGRHRDGGAGGKPRGGAPESTKDLELHPLRARTRVIKKPEPGPLVASLAQLLGTKGVRPGGIVRMDDVRALHERDMRDCAAREACMRAGRRGRGGQPSLSVFGVPLGEVCAYASTRTVFGSSNQTPGWELDLPVVVVDCVEEIWRRGAFDIKFFCSPSVYSNQMNPESWNGIPSTRRVQRLMEIYNTQKTSFGASHPLTAPGPTTVETSPRTSERPSMPTTAEIVDLLKLYLCSLPEPVLPPPLGEAMRACCLATDFTSSSPSFAADTRVVQILLCFAPSASFALLVYILAFLRHFISDQGGAVDEAKAVRLGEVFGGLLFGNGEDLEGKKRKLRDSDGRNGGDMMVWILVHWGVICDGLFDSWGGLEEAGGKEPYASRAEAGVDTPMLSAQSIEDKDEHNLQAQPPPWLPSRKGPGDMFGTSPSMGSLEELRFDARGTGFSGTGSSGAGVQHRGRDIQPVILVPSPSQGLFETATAGSDSESGTTCSLSENSAVKGTGGMDLAGGLGGSRRDMEVESMVSVASGPALEERLLDISFPPPIEFDVSFSELFGSQGADIVSALARGNEDVDGATEEDDAIKPPPDPPGHTAEVQAVGPPAEAEVLERIRKLEWELAQKGRVAAEAVARAARLEARVHALEAQKAG